MYLLTETMSPPDSRFDEKELAVLNQLVLWSEKRLKSTPLELFHFSFPHPDLISILDIDPISSEKINLGLYLKSLI